jgi:hypothetical protein
MHLLLCPLALVLQRDLHAVLRAVRIAVALPL